MSSKADEKILAEIHNAIASDLLKKIQSGEATAAELNVARQFLRDNNISTIPTGNNPLKQLEESLPFASPENLDDESEFRH